MRPVGIFNTKEGIMSKIEFIYFDVGGTLLDWKDAFRTAAEKFDLTVQEINTVFLKHHDEITKGLMTTREFWKACINKYNLKNADDYDFLDSWVGDYKPIKEMHKLVMKIKDKYKIGLLSNIYEGMRPILLKKKIIPDIKYDQIIFSCEVQMRKQNMEIFELATKKAKTKPEKILLVDDRKDFLANAESLGWQTFWFDNENRADAVNGLETFLRSF
jgi:HAD superfamily hydrolase (TIGR01509 family)